MASDDNEPKRSVRIRTLADLNRSSVPYTDGDSLNFPQQHHAGGDRSGYDADAIFNQAMQMAAHQNQSNMPSSPSSSRSFTGTARTLSGEILPAAPQQPEPPEQELVLWNDGFSVNNGPFRRLDDPENASFFESIKKAEIPEELKPDYEVSGLVIRIRRKFRNYSEPERTTVPFQGEGRILGSDTPASSPEPAVSAPPPALGLVIDETKPTTSIQIRLADGTRMIAQFNNHHTINDIRSYIDSLPGGSRNYQLQAAGLPPMPLNDPNQTIEEADIANSVVFLKLL